MAPGGGSTLRQRLIELSRDSVAYYWVLVAPPPPVPPRPPDTCMLIFMNHALEQIELLL